MFLKMMEVVDNVEKPQAGLGELNEQGAAGPGFSRLQKQKAIVLPSLVKQIASGFTYYRV